MDTKALAVALSELAARERDAAAAVTRKTERPAGLLIPRSDLIALLNATAALLRALAPGQCSVPIFPGDDVDVRCRVIEHQGDCIVVEHPSLHGSERALVGPAAISKVYPISLPA